jgi:hypothetical protein
MERQASMESPDEGSGIRALMTTRMNFFRVSVVEGI